MADTLIFLKIDGGGDPESAPAIEGESTAVGFEKQIELESVDWTVKASVDTSGRAVQPDFGEVTLQKYVDLSTCTLIELAKTRKRTEPKDAIPQMTITYVDMVLTKDGTNHAVPVVEFKVYGCYLESIALSVASGGKGSVALTETLVVSYDKIDIIYHPVGSERLQRGAAMTFRGLAAGNKAH